MNQLAQEIIAANVAPGSIRIWWIGQEGFVIKSPRLIIYIDLNTGDVNEFSRLARRHSLPHRVMQAGESIVFPESNK
jgi:L-ascorbate metabolism protein UlaG (beta-lactamase superfamily)